MLLLVSYTTVTNYHKLSSLKQQDFFLSQFWRPEVQNQGANRATLTLRTPREDPSLPLPASGVASSPSCYLACRYITPISASHGVTSHGMEQAFPQFSCLQAASNTGVASALSWSWMAPGQTTLGIAPQLRLYEPTFHSELILLQTKSEPHYHYLISV